MRFTVRVAHVLLFLAGATALAQAQSVLNFPRISIDSTSFTGVAIANPGPADASVVLTLRGPDGQILTDPLNVTVPAGQQFARLASDIFGNVPNASTAWLQAVSEANDLTGFFLYLNPSVTFFDGADLPRAANRVAFNEVRIGDGFSTELNIINPGPLATTVQLRLLGGDTPVTRSLEVAGRGVARIDAAELFGVGAASASAVRAGNEPALSGRYIVAESDGPEIAGSALTRTAGDLLGQNAVPVDDGLATLFFPQLAVLGPLQSQLVIVNYGDEPAILTIYAHKPDGTLYDGENLMLNPVAEVLQPGQALRRDLAELFGFFGDESLQGWLEVESSVQEVNGSISYSIPAIGSLAAVSSVAQGSRGAIFSHIATASGFFTGVAILNPAALVANYQIIALRPNGTLLGSYSSILAPGQRVSMLIDEFIGAAAGQAGGLILVRSDIPVFLTSLFGNQGTGVLANIPAQPVPDSFQPDTGQTMRRISPALAVVAPGGSQTFTLSPAPAQTIWSVPGAGNVNGVVSATGRYTAPALRPDIVPVVVAAQTGSLTVGASVDVISARELAEGLGTVQSVVYSEGLQRVFAAELQGVGALLAIPAGASPAGPPPPLSEVLDVTNGSRVLIKSFPNQDIAKMLAFAANGKNYLLLLDRSGGRVTRLDPQSGDSTVVTTGLNQPVAMTFDPANGDCLVAEFDRVTRITRSLFVGSQAGTASAAVSHTAARSLPAGVGGLAGIAVDRCDGQIYVSRDPGSQLQSAGTDPYRGAGLLRINPVSRQVAPVGEVTLPLGQLLAIYRSGSTCPEAFHLLAVDPTQDRIELINPSMDLETTWVENAGAVDLSFIPPRRGETMPQAALVDSTVIIGVAQFDEETGTTQGFASLAEAPGLYRDLPVNPPIQEDLVPRFDAVADFSPETNPSGTWRYGYETEYGAQFQPFLTGGAQVGSIPISDGFSWFVESETVGSGANAVTVDEPSLGGNLGGGTIEAGPVVWPADMLLLHPGPNGRLAVLRWTAPEDGNYRIDGAFQSLEEASVDVYVAVSGQAEAAFSSALQGADGRVAFGFLLEAVQAGTTIDFLVGPGERFENDSVGLQAVIVKEE